MNLKGHWKYCNDKMIRHKLLAKVLCILKKNTRDVTLRIFRGGYYRKDVCARYFRKKGLFNVEEKGLL